MKIAFCLCFNRLNIIEGASLSLSKATPALGFPI
jgi:hypothetical protein